MQAFLFENQFLLSDKGHTVTVVVVVDVIVVLVAAVVAVAALGTLAGVVKVAVAVVVVVFLALDSTWDSSLKFTTHNSIRSVVCFLLCFDLSQFPVFSFSSR